MKICEKDVSRIWQEGRFNRLRDEEGNEVEVIYGGRPSAGKGCDFQDAVLKVNGIKRCGDVEIHVSSDLWKKHGHGRNPIYNNVILHVALWEKGGLPAFDCGGRAVPTVILGAAPAQFVTRSPGCPHVNRLCSRDLAEIINGCGLQRLYSRAEEYAASIQQKGPQQALYLAICRSLGYARNKAPMVRLAGLLPFSFWQGLNTASSENKQAVALGTAGLLPSQCAGLFTAGPDRLTMRNEQAWEKWPRPLTVMSRAEWCFSAVRPANSPPRRVAALCELLGKPGGAGVSIFRDIITGTDGWFTGAAIEQYLLVDQPDYWSNHYDFGRAMRRPLALLGRGRAREIAVNSILPFYLAYGSEGSISNMAEKMVEIYSRYPALPANEIALFMQDLLIPGESGGVNACRQQGLLFIFHNYCRTRDCMACPVFRRRRPGWGQRPNGRYRSGRR